MSLFKVRHYVVYRNEVLFVNPAEWPDGKWRRRRPSKAEISFTRPAEIAYQVPEGARVRFAARRIRCVGFDSCVDDESVMRYIRTVERIETRKRLHDAEREKREADGMLAGAIRARRRFKDDVRNGRYPGGPIGTEMAIDADRRTRHAMESARHRAVCAARNLYWMLVGLGTITEDEATRRIGAVASWGTEYEG